MHIPNIQIDMASLGYFETSIISILTSFSFRIILSFDLIRLINWDQIFFNSIIIYFNSLN